LVISTSAVVVRDTYLAYNMPTAIRLERPLILFSLGRTILHGIRLQLTPRRVAPEHMDIYCQISDFSHEYAYRICLQLHLEIVFHWFASLEQIGGIVDPPPH
jgi:hypothetical protein